MLEESVSKTINMKRKPQNISRLRDRTTVWNVWTKMRREKKHHLILRRRRSRKKKYSNMSETSFSIAFYIRNHSQMNNNEERNSINIEYIYIRICVCILYACMLSIYMNIMRIAYYYYWYLVVCWLFYFINEFRSNKT